MRSQNIIRSAAVREGFWCWCERRTLSLSMCWKSRLSRRFQGFSMENYRGRIEENDSRWNIKSIFYFLFEFLKFDRISFEIRMRPITHTVSLPISFLLACVLLYCCLRSNRKFKIENNLALHLMLFLFEAKFQWDKCLFVCFRILSSFEDVDVREMKR